MPHIDDRYKRRAVATERIASCADAAVCSLADQQGAYTLFAPIHYEPGYAYPLIVWLHGQNDDERQLLRVMPMLSIRNYVAVAPRGSCTGTDASGRSVFGWKQTIDDALQAQQRVIELIETVAGKLHVCPQRVFLVGFDSGGTMAVRIAWQRPDRFAGAVSLCGPMPTAQPTLGNLVAARRVPLLLATGRAGQKYPQAAVCADLRLLHSAGMSVTLRVYPGGDELSPQMLADVDRWIIEQITNPQPSGVGV